MRAQIGRDARPLPATGDIRQHAVNRTGRGDEKDVAVAGQPCRGIGKYRKEGRDDRSEIRAGDVVGMRPLADHAARGEAAPRRGKELPREQRRDARHPGIRRLGDDDVVELRCQQQM